MTTRRSLLWLVLIVLLLLGATGLWVRAQQWQYAQNRALIAALVKGNTTQALALINEGADPNTRETPPPMPSLKLLLDQLLHHAPPANNSPTALVIAAEKGNLTILKWLLVQGAKVETRATGGYFTALYYAVEQGHKDCAEALLAEGADPNTANVDGEPALLLAAKQWPDIARMLIVRGADVNGGDVTGGTVLMYAVEGEQVPLIRFLLARGADVHNKDEGEETALSLAKKKHNKILIHLLQEAEGK